VQCFELSAVAEIGVDVLDNPDWRPQHDAAVFLPAPLTWLEFRPEKRLNVARRWGFLLTQKSAEVFEICHATHTDAELSVTPAFIVRVSHGSVAVDCEETVRQWRLHHPEIEPDHLRKGIEALAWLVMGCLSIINTPAIFKHTEHEPHAGLRRELVRRGLLEPSRRQRPWVEIKLDIRPPSDLPGGGERMTGTKALHFCRAHMRFRLGKVEWVRSHWRGDASKGVVRHDYRVRA
jgi:hypothetical protein